MVYIRPEEMAKLRDILIFFLTSTLVLIATRLGYTPSSNSYHAIFRKSSSPSILQHCIELIPPGQDDHLPTLGTCWSSRLGTSP